MSKVPILFVKNPKKKKDHSLPSGLSGGDPILL